MLTFCVLLLFFPVTEPFVLWYSPQILHAEFQPTAITYFKTQYLSFSSCSIFQTSSARKFPSFESQQSLLVMHPILCTKIIN